MTLDSIKQSIKQTPFFECEDGLLYCADCMDILPQLPEGCVDLVLTDPPYGIGFSEYNSHKDDPKVYNKWIWSVTEQAEKLVSNGWMCVFQAAKKCREWPEMFPRDWRLLSFPKNFVQIFKVHGPTWATDYALLWEIGEAD
jgi:DNA modification methylase